MQRVTSASVAVEGNVVGEINGGILLLLGVQHHDDEALARKLADKVSKYRMFADENGKTNLNVSQVDGDILVVSQFTLAADTNSGLRPSFSSAATPEQGLHLYQYFVDYLREKGFKVPTGEFGADMQVSLVNDGPVTFSLSV